MPDSRIHTLTVCTPGEVTLTVATSPDRFRLVHVQVTPSTIRPLMSDAPAVAPSNPTYKESEASEFDNARIHM